MILGALAMAVGLTALILIAERAEPKLLPVRIRVRDRD